MIINGINSILGLSELHLDFRFVSRLII